MVEKQDRTNQCFALVRNKNRALWWPKRCGRMGDWRFFCPEHGLFPWVLTFTVLLSVFSVLAGFASISSWWNGPQSVIVLSETAKLPESKVTFSIPKGVHTIREIADVDRHETAKNLGDAALIAMVLESTELQLTSLSSGSIPFQIRRVECRVDSNRGPPFAFTMSSSSKQFGAMKDLEGGDVIHPNQIRVLKMFPMDSRPAALSSDQQRTRLLSTLNEDLSARYGVLELTIFLLTADGRELKSDMTTCVKYQTTGKHSLVALNCGQEAYPGLSTLVVGNSVGVDPKN